MENDSIIMLCWETLHGGTWYTLSLSCNIQETDMINQDDIYKEDPHTKGAMYCPLIYGADKTTVSVATGQVEYHPLYLSLGNVFNTIRRAHRNAVVPIGFLAIPKCRWILIFICAISIKSLI